MDKILTIVIPSYNMEKYLDRCLSSLIVDEIHMKMFETLVVNDGSRDRTSVIAHQYEARYPETFRVIDKENGHYGSCVNRGLAEATGTFIKVLDADDSINNTIFPSFLDFLNSDKNDVIDMVVSDYAYVNDSLVIQEVVNYSSHDGTYGINDLSEYDKYVWFIHGITYRTSILRRNSYKQSEGILYSDLEWSTLPLAYIKSIAKFDGVLYNYTIGREGQSVSNDIHNKHLEMELTVKEQLLLRSEQFKDVIDHNNYSFIQDRIQILINYTYQSFIFSQKRHACHNKALLLFDDMLKNKFPIFYSSSNDYATCLALGLRFHPIRDWRQKRHLSLFFQSLLYFLSSLWIKADRTIR